MIANYHTHTPLCHHSSGTEEEFIKKAIAEGVKILGFSDHAPYIYPAPYVSEYKMAPSEIGKYFDTLIALREKYADKIEIHIGFEAEYYPNLFDETLALWRSYPTEYLILGQHMIYNEYDRPRITPGAPTEDVKRMSDYVDLVCRAIATDRFSYIAHPDIMRYTGDINIYREYMSRMIAAAKAADLPLEINLLGLSEGRFYPYDRFWELVSDFDASVIIGCDAHSTKRVADPDEYNAALGYARRLGLRVLDTIQLKNPIF